MNRTYNPFVDNGLYILGSYLDKDIGEITIDDIKNSTEMFADNFIKYEDCSYYKKTISMGFQNSSYTQRAKGETKEDTREKIKNQFNLMLNNIGDDEYCSVCGEKHIKLNADENYLNSMSRIFMPRIHANTFANYINNLQIVNICSICLYLSMISLYNCTKTSDTLTIYISDDDEFMEDYTFMKQNELKQNMSMELKGNKKNQKWYYKHIEETIENIIHNSKIYNGYIQAISFNNSAQTEIYIDHLLSNRDIKFIKLLEEKSLLSEFKEKWLFKYLIDGNLQRNYLSYVIDFFNNKMRISKELFNEIEEVYCKLKKDKLNLIKITCKKIYENNTKNEIKQLKSIGTINQFENLLINWGEQYKEKTNMNLFSTDEFDDICNIKEFSTIKNRMTVEFMSLQ